MCATSCTLLAFLSLGVSRPARAAHWQFHTTGADTLTENGTVHNNPPWQPPSDSPNGISVSETYIGGATPQAPTTATVNLSLHIVGTWTADASDPSPVPPPPSVVINETSKASAGGTNQAGQTFPGTADDGCGDSTGSTVNTPPGGRYTVVQAQGGVITIDRTLNATMTSQPNPDTNSGPPNYTFTPGVSSGGAAVGAYTMSIHAQPYGWHDEGHFDTSGNQLSGPKIDNTAGTMTFLYTFMSTSGNIANLANIRVYEYVDYSGNAGSFGTDNTGPYYRPSSPPIGKTASGNIFELDQPHYGYVNPTVPYPRDSTGHTMSYAGDGHSPFPVMKPYSTLTITAPQKYEFDDPATGEKGTVLYSPGSIVDAVKLNPNVFYISKSGYNVKSPLPQ